MADLQELQHGQGYNYERGSPHLRHAVLRNQIVARIRGLVADQFVRTGSCRILEIGAGHGGFTDHLAATGAEVTVTEMSRPSLDLLRERFAWNRRVSVVYDPDGKVVASDPSLYDLVFCISVLHHVPDYLSFVELLTTRIDEGGTFASFQDPLWYPRRSRANLGVDRAAYYAWRICQRNMRQGMSTFVRRARGIYDENNVADMVEYHVVRDGVEEEALEALLSSRFRGVRQWRYWSTQNSILQAAGTRLGIDTTFGIIGTGRFVHDCQPVIQDELTGRALMGSADDSAPTEHQPLECLDSSPCSDYPCA